MSKLNTYFEKGMSKLLPGIYSTLIKKGYYVENRWKNKKTFKYLQDDHPDRKYFIDFVNETGAGSILEVGAGSQFEARTLRDAGKLDRISYTIMDINEFWLQEGARIMPEVSFRQGSINRIPFPDNSFDIVYCRHVIEHQPYYEDAIKELMRASKDWVFLNIFRWSLQDDIINRAKYYTNSYSLDKLLTFCRGISKEMTAFIILKEGRKELGPNIKKDEVPHVRRTGDHMVILMRKNSGIPEGMPRKINEVTNADILYDIPR